MAARSYQQQLVREELDAHIEDMTADLISDGMDPAEAKALAKREFGNQQDIEAEVLQIHRRWAWLPWSPAALISAVYGIGLLIVVVITFVFFESIEGTAIEVITVWTIYGAIIGMALLILLWFSEYVGWHTRSMLFMGAAVSMLLAISLTIIFDIDKFETTIHAAAFSLLVILVGNVVWKYLGIRVRQVLVYLPVVIVLRSIITHDPLFSYIAKPGCWFITQDGPLTGTLASCTQTYWWSPVLLPIYVTLIISTTYVGFYLVRYLRSQHVNIIRKVGMSAGFVSMIATPVFVHDINDHAWFDVLHKKPEIYQSYQDILGRNPTDSEMEFYAKTRSYEHMNKIRQVLLASDERTQKIHIIYNNTLGRDATEQELEQHSTNNDSISDIKLQLQSL